MELTIPQERTFQCPEGSFRATFAGARVHRRFKANKIEESIRLIFEVDVPGIHNKIVTVARNFPPNIEPGTQFRCMLESWLGREFFKENAGNKIDFDDLVGREADIMVEHYQNKDFREPFCNLVAIYPAGTLPLGKYADN